MIIMGYDSNRKNLKKISAKTTFAVIKSCLMAVGRLYRIKSVLFLQLSSCRICFELWKLFVPIFLIIFGYLQFSHRDISSILITRIPQQDQWPKDMVWYFTSSCPWERNQVTRKSFVSHLEYGWLLTESDLV